MNKQIISLVTGITSFITSLIILIFLIFQFKEIDDEEGFVLYAVFFISSSSSLIYTVITKFGHTKGTENDLNIEVTNLKLKIEQKELEKKLRELEEKKP